METKVLIAEDNDDCRSLLRTLLSHLGCSVVEARNGLEVIQRAVSTSPDLIIMDLRMPKLGGLEVTKRLKERVATRDIPIVICTALGMEAFGYTKLLDHSFEIVHKPIRLEKIRDIVRKYVPQENQQQTSIQVEKKETLNVVERVGYSGT